MLQVMTMKHIAPAIARKGNQDVCRLAGAEIDRIFPAHVIGAGPAAVPENLEVSQVKMQRMAEVRAEMPDLRGVQSRTGVHARGFIPFSIDPPVAAVALVTEIEDTRCY